MSPRDAEIENLSKEELLHFTEPGRLETLLDAGCGTGVNILRLHSRVRNVIGIDYAKGSLERCQKRIQTQKLKNVQLCLGSVAAIPLPDRSIDKILCLSVLQYLDDQEVRQALREFVRVLRPGGVLILHVKNSSSLYWSTLQLAKALKGLLGWTTRLYYLRSFRWYANELAFLNCNILDYNSFNLLVLEGMPKTVLSLLQRFELRHRSAPFFRAPFIRRHGAELKIKAAVVDRLLNSNPKLTSLPPHA
jgi:ubiquinone/menaquinone biosynthesis C-methylase UbiE